MKRGNDSYEIRPRPPKAATEGCAGLLLVARISPCPPSFGCSLLASFDLDRGSRGNPGGDSHIGRPLHLGSFRVDTRFASKAAGTAGRDAKEALIPNAAPPKSKTRQNPRPGP